MIGLNHLAISQTLLGKPWEFPQTELLFIDGATYISQKVTNYIVKESLN